MISAKLAVLAVLLALCIFVYAAARLRGQGMIGNCRCCGKRDVRLYAARRNGQRVFVCIKCLLRVK